MLLSHPLVADDCRNLIFFGIEQIDVRHANQSGSPRSLERACQNPKC